MQLPCRIRTLPNNGSHLPVAALTEILVLVRYYSLAASQILYADAPARLRKGAPRNPVPVVLLARLAVNRTWPGKGLGAGLLKDAIIRVLTAAEGVGVRALVVHAKDEAAKAFYERYVFVPLPSYPMHLVLLLKDARRIVSG